MASSDAFGMTTPGLSPIAMTRSLWKHRSLFGSMLARELQSRYRGSFLGPLWFLVTPALMLVVFTFVFGVVFAARTPYAAEDSGTLEFGVYLFSGLLIFQIFSEAISRAPSLIIANAPYVTRVVFPLENLGAVAVAAAFVNGALSFIALMIGMVIVYGSIPIGALAYPLAVLMLAPMTLGLTWIIASLGAYIRDIGQFVGVALSALMFLSPVFYPLDRLPAFVRRTVALNPVSVPIETVHTLLFTNSLPTFAPLAIYFTASCLVLFVGWVVFQALRPGFADVL